MMLLLELIQVALGYKLVLSHTPSIEEWKEMYYQAEKQAVLGVCFQGIQILKGQKQYPPKELLLQWIGVAERIKAQNILVYKKSFEITKIFSDAGFRSCILKGQGNALMYANPYSRISGDIDIWIYPDGINKVLPENRIRSVVNSFVKSQYPNADEQNEHIEYPIYKYVPVEVHYKPAVLFNPCKDNHFQNFCNEQRDIQMNNSIDLPDGYGRIFVPTQMFNAVFQMVHVMNHFFIEGIGLRHFIDYYYVLKANTYHTNITNLFEEFGLMRFARGVMWIEKECLGLEDKYLLVEPDERRGRVILKEMMEGGNFGHYDERYKSREKGYIARGLTDVYRLMKLALVFPSESMWKIYRKVENQKWKIK